MEDELTQYILVCGFDYLALENPKGRLDFLRSARTRESKLAALKPSARRVFYVLDFGSGLAQKREYKPGSGIPSISTAVSVAQRVSSDLKLYLQGVG